MLNVKNEIPTKKNKYTGLFKGKNLNNVNSHTINYGYILDKDEIVDEVLVSIMRNPHSYTGEDTVEINCHGGIYVTKAILALVLRNGASMAEAGEFTKRSFLNGKMDLSQAEAVMDLINSGIFGLMIAFDKFDVRKYVKFSTVAVEYVRQNINRYIYKKVN